MTSYVQFLVLYLFLNMTIIHSRVLCSAAGHFTLSHNMSNIPYIYQLSTVIKIPLLTNHKKEAQIRQPYLTKNYPTEILSLER